MVPEKITDTYSFPKEERLHGQKAIQMLFAKGKSVFLFPFKVLYLPYHHAESPSSFPSILVSVPKKNFKKATLRNRLKRQIREAYRTQKHNFHFQQYETPLQSLAFIYVAKEMLPYATIHQKLAAAMLLVHKNCQQKSAPPKGKGQGL